MRYLAPILTIGVLLVGIIVHQTPTAHAGEPTGEIGPMNPTMFKCVSKDGKTLIQPDPFRKPLTRVTIKGGEEFPLDRIDEKCRQYAVHPNMGTSREDLGLHVRCFSVGDCFIRGRGECGAGSTLARVGCGGRWNRGPASKICTPGGSSNRTGVAANPGFDYGFGVKRISSLSE